MASLLQPPPLEKHKLQHYTPSEAANSTRKLYLRTEATDSELKTRNPATSLHRPETLRAISTPTLSSDLKVPIHASGAITPPPTPTETFGYLENGSSVREMKDMGPGSGSGKPESTTLSSSSIRFQDEKEEQGSTTLKEFPYWMTDYDCGEKGKRRLLGSGLWSDVYLAVPSLPQSASSTTPSGGPGTTTPPATPIATIKTSYFPQTLTLTHLPTAYAIKAPASRSAKQVLSQEATILSYLSRFPDSANHMVEFYGQDTRTGTLVLKAMDVTLENWIQKELNTLSETARADKLASTFVRIAKDLIDGLTWMAAKDCVHADIKPSNILLSSSTPTAQMHTSSKCVYSDFSSAALPTTVPPAENTTKTPLGGGTWDFLDPVLLKPSSSNSAEKPSPTHDSDLWALAVTLLYLVLGSSPFDCVGSNVFRRREIIKHGTPLLYAVYADEGAQNLRRLRGLGDRLGFDIEKWFGMVLVRERDKRVGVAEWKGFLDGK